MIHLLFLRRILSHLRSSQSGKIAAFVDDPLKAQKEVRFLMIRLIVIVSIALAGIIGSVIIVRRNVLQLEEQRALQRTLYGRFEVVTRLSHDVTEGRAALATMDALFPKDDNLLPFLKALEAIAKKTDTTATFRFEQSTPTPAPNIPPYRFITYSIMVSGNARTLLAYLTALPQLPYAIVLDSMTLSGENGIEKNTTMNLKGRLYVQ